MAGIRKFLLAVMPARWRVAAEAESRRWMAICGTCGTETSVWDMGGIRWKARGSPRFQRRCETCGKVTWHRLEFRPDAVAGEGGD